jgi:hypothetical protein
MARERMRKKTRMGMKRKKGESEQQRGEDKGVLNLEQQELQITASHSLKLVRSNSYHMVNIELPQSSALSSPRGTRMLQIAKGIPTTALPYICPDATIGRVREPLLAHSC